MVETMTEKALATSEQITSLPPLNDDLRSILGRPCFHCIKEAEWLRRRGFQIERRAEDEQAAVIHWALGFYLKHGVNWVDAANEWLQKTKPQGVA